MCKPRWEISTSEIQINNLTSQCQKHSTISMEIQTNCLYCLHKGTNVQQINRQELIIESIESQILTIGSKSPTPINRLKESINSIELQEPNTRSKLQFQ